MSCPPPFPRVRKTKTGDPDDTPPVAPPPQDSEESIVVDMTTRKEGDRSGKNGGRILFFDEPGAENDRAGSSTGARGMTVEQVVLRERSREGGWAGLHCECQLIMFLTMLLLWEDIFDTRVKAASSHCLTVRRGESERRKHRSILRTGKSALPPLTP